jgi:transposase
VGTGLSETIGYGSREASCSQATIGYREASDCRADIGGWAECSGGGLGPRCKRESVFKWRREFEQGNLSGSVRTSCGLLPVTVPSELEMQAAGIEQRSTAAGIEFPGRALISIEGGADAVLLRVILESLGK